jgi:A/G-specific adenine glycosylase
MLQQTQVSRVVERYAQFMQVFPTVQRLALADEQDVLRLWQGLGYYRRARNLHASARMIVSEFRGRVPCEIEQLMRLPGVGRYTAGAIASMVFGRPEPIVDGNVHRVLSRVFARRAVESGRAPAGRSAAPELPTWPLAQMLVERASRPGVFNEALMELGATVCLPSPAAPCCDRCPIARWCNARRLGVQQQVPTSRPRARQKWAHHHAVIVRRPRSALLLLQQRLTDVMWAGMWQTPTVEANVALDTTQIARLLSVQVGGLRKEGEFIHQTTHRRIRFHVYTATSRTLGGTWRSPDDVEDLPMSNAQRRVLGYVGPAGGAD